ncbi:MAG: class I SAM-dependent methyltransferase [Deltaproteobacteria bacterium]|nr:class I SAM-dependent methyltransferase [Deltaproteobacteria bacterium]
MDAPREKTHSRTAGVFTDVQGHILAAEVVRRHSINQEDIRSLALKGQFLAGCRKVLDLGCGFGFFTEALKGRVHPEASVTGIDRIEGYRPLFLEAVRKAGQTGEYLSSGAATLKTFGKDTYDLVLCSYALYFFPEIIPDIARILKRGGKFITITHRRKNMGELIAAIRDILSEKDLCPEDPLPVEKVIERFCGENGSMLLAPWFKHVQAIEYENSLTFHRDDQLDLVAYFRYKSPFFLSGLDLETEAAVHLLSTHLQETLTPAGAFTMSKDDTIFVCSAPLYGRRVLHEEEP